MPKETAVRIRREEEDVSNISLRKKDKQSKLNKQADDLRRKKRRHQEQVVARSAGAALVAAILILTYESYHGIERNYHDRHLHVQLENEANSFLPPGIAQSRNKPVIPDWPPSRTNDKIDIEPLFESEKDEATTGGGDALAPRATAHGRFPLYGTDEFAQACPYAVKLPSTAQSNCAVFAHRSPNSSEGLAAWAASVTMAYFMSLEKHCTFYVDYLPHVDLTQILTAPNGASVRWKVPPKDFECLKSENCYPLLGKWGGSTMPPLPNYRFLYSPSLQRVNATRMASLEQTFPGFQATTGMACAWAHFQLAPSASRYVPRLFTQLLPALRDPAALVISLYIRTGRTDALEYQERNKTSAAMERLLKEQNDVTSLKGLPEKIAACALQLEKEYLGKDSLKQRVVWMVVTDAPSVGALIADAYSGKSVEGANDSIRRAVLTTQSRGVQTKPSRNPTTEDVAEGMIDWFLIGESDLVIQGGGVSFGATGALRTARPLYNFGTCEVKKPSL